MFEVLKPYPVSNGGKDLYFDVLRFSQWYRIMKIYKGIQKMFRTQTVINNREDFTSVMIHMRMRYKYLHSDNI